MTEPMLLASALVTGLLGSPHCALMCGGIAGGFSVEDSRPSMFRAMQPNLGRIAGYVVAGALAGVIGHGLVELAASPPLRMVLRSLAGVALLLLALRLAGRGPGSLLDAPARAVMAPLQSLRFRFLRPRTTVQRVLAGVLWGWLPCGLSISMLTVAWLRADPLDGAMLMLAFGVGGLPAMVSLTWTGARLGQRLLRSALRPLAVTLVAVAGALTVVAPWVHLSGHVHPLLAALGCGSAIRSW